VPTSDRSRNRTRQTDPEPPERATEALARARKHTHAAIAEALAAVHALLDASSLALSGEASASNTLLGPIARILEGLRAEFDESATARGVARFFRASRAAVGVRDPSRTRRGWERRGVEARRAQEGASDLHAAKKTACATRKRRGVIRDLRRTIPRRRSGLTWHAETQNRISRRYDARNPR